MIRRLTRTVFVGDGAMRTYVARPDASDAPAVVVLHGAAGLDDAARAACDAIARLGYLAVCPDLQWRAPADGGNIDPGDAVDGVNALVEAIRRETLGHEGLAVLGHGPPGVAEALRAACPELAVAAPGLELAAESAEPASADAVRIAEPVRAWLERRLGPGIVSAA